jgi:hypothetical protein
LFGRESAEHQRLAMFSTTYVAVEAFEVSDRKRDRLSLSIRPLHRRNSGENHV